MVKNLFLLIIAFIALGAIVAFQFLFTGFFTVFVVSLFTEEVPYVEWYEMIVIGGIMDLFFWFIGIGRGNKYGKKPKE